MNLKNKTQLEFRKSNLLLSNSKSNINKNYFHLSSSYSNFIKNNRTSSKPLSLTNYSDILLFINFNSFDNFENLEFS